MARAAGVETEIVVDATLTLDKGERTTRGGGANRGDCRQVHRCVSVIDRDVNSSGSRGARGVLIVRGCRLGGRLEGRKLSILVVRSLRGLLELAKDERVFVHRDKAGLELAAQALLELESSIFFIESRVRNESFKLCEIGVERSVRLSELLDFFLSSSLSIEVAEGLF